MHRSESLRAKHKEIGRKRVADALASGLRPRTCYLPAEILPFLDELKMAQGFRRRDEAITYLVRDAMRRRPVHERKEQSAVKT